MATGMAMPRVGGRNEMKRWKIYIFKNVMNEWMNEWTLELANICIKLTRAVSHCDLAIDIKKVSLRQKEELWKLKYFTMPKI